MIVREVMNGGVMKHYFLNHAKKYKMNYSQKGNYLLFFRRGMICHARIFEQFRDICQKYSLTCKLFMEVNYGC